MTEQQTGEDGLRIVKLAAENVKRLKAIEITPSGDVVRITDMNEWPEDLRLREFPEF